jgi:hypothetical protein
LNQSSKEVTDLVGQGESRQGERPGDHCGHLAPQDAEAGRGSGIAHLGADLMKQFLQ